MLEQNFNISSNRPASLEVKKDVNVTLHYAKLADLEVDYVNEAKYWTPAGEWTTKPKDIDGYTLVNVKGAEHGKFTVFNYITTYVYAKKVNCSVVYIDDTTGQTLKNDSLAEAKINDQISYTTADKIKYLEDKGYKLVSNDFKDGKEIYKDGANKFEVHFVHSTRPVTPDNPGKPGEPINPNDPNGHKFPKESGKTDLTKTNTRVVNYVDENGKSLVDHPASETITLSGQGVLDKVTGKWIMPITWNQGSFTEINTPEIPNYHVTGVTTDGKIYYSVDQKAGNVGKTTVTHEKGNTVVTVPFSKNSKPEQPTTPVNPTTPVVPEENVTPHPETPATPENAEVKNEKDPSPVNDENVKPKANKFVQTSTKVVVSTKAANELPQTGENSDDALANLGLAFISSISLIGLAGVKKRKN